MADSAARVASGPTQREQAAAEARTRILAAAADCIVRDGLAQVRMASIARAAGVSAGLLHYHFDTKELLFGEVLTYSHGVSAELNQRAMAGAGEGPAERLSAFLDRCLPSDEQRAHEWLLWQELALLCIRDPHLAKVGADLYEDLYATVADIVSEGLAAGVFDTALDPQVPGRDGGGPHRRTRRPGPGERPQPRARARRAPPSPPPSASWSATTARCPPPAPFEDRSRGVTPRPRLGRRTPLETRLPGRGPGARRVPGAARLRLHPRRRPRRRPAADVGEGRDRRRPRLLQLGRLPRPEASSRASRRSTASRSSSPTSTRWRACTPRSPPATSTTSSSRSPSGSSSCAARASSAPSTPPS